VASYWLGIARVAMTVILRGLAAWGSGQSWRQMGAGITRITFHRAAKVFLLLSIAAGLMSRWYGKTS
jgi:hypothetical protein